MTEEHKNKNNNIEEMFREASNDDLSKQRIQSSIEQKKRKMIIQSVAVTSVLIFGGVTGLYFWSQTNNETTKVERYAQESGEISSEQLEKIPVEIPDWVKKGNYDPEKTEKNRKEIAEDIHYTSFGNITGTIGGDSDKFTTNEDEKDDKDSEGLLINKNYAAVTGEDYEYWSNVYINRLLNPQFGKWTILQSPNPDFAVHAAEIFKDMFDDAYWNNQSTDMKWLPILADFNQDNYGGLKFKYDTRFVGKYTSIYGDIKSSEDGFKTTTTVFFDVEWKAFDENGKEIVKTGHISLDLEPRKDDSRISKNKIVITNSKITINN